MYTNRLPLQKIYLYPQILDHVHTPIHTHNNHYYEPHNRVASTIVNSLAEADLGKFFGGKPYSYAWNGYSALA